MTYEVRVLGSSSSGAAEVLQSLRGEAPSVDFSQAEAGTELEDLDVATGDTREDRSMYARTSLRAFVDMLRDSGVTVDKVFQVSYCLVSPSPSHIVVVGAEGFHLCSCLQLLQHGYPCRHLFAVIVHLQRSRATDTEHRYAFDANSVHPRWRAMRALVSERWTGSKVIPDEQLWVGAEGPTFGEGGGNSTGDVGSGSGAASRVHEGVRRRVYADCLAMSRRRSALIAASPRPSEALDMYAGLDDRLESQLRERNLLPAVSHPGGGEPSVRNPKQANVKGRKRKKRQKSSTEKR